MFVNLPKLSGDVDSMEVIHGSIIDRKTRPPQVRLASDSRSWLSTVSTCRRSGKFSTQVPVSDSW
ncbi:hypothetical protein H4W26_001915 [Nesterenkonia halotolerans]|uniref:Uncharacterized protein n=1 Tax=Nesterenkonia halotolerans TaxID=225325 RepID=A0ABR9J847_9MICC|nr:hypothetical protein [Nesterenkonia halotolerans]